MSDLEATIRRFLGGDEGAFEEIVREWQTRVFNLAWRFLGSRDEAQDVVQDTFLSVFQSLGKLRDPRSFPAWIYRITLNHCRSRYRSRPAEVSLDQPLLDADDSGDSFIALIASGGQKQVEMLDLLRKALASLSEEHRSAILLKEYLGLSLEEVAAVMECPLSTAKSRLYHGLRGVQRNLRRLLATAAPR